MSYTKQTWATGDVITAQKLNHMEDGIGGGDCNVFLVPITVEYDGQGSCTCSTTVSFENAKAAALSGKVVVGALRNDQEEQNTSSIQIDYALMVYNYDSSVPTDNFTLEHDGAELTFDATGISEGDGGK